MRRGEVKRDSRGPVKSRAAKNSSSRIGGSFSARNFSFRKFSTGRKESMWVALRGTAPQKASSSSLPSPSLPSPMFCPPPALVDTLSCVLDLLFSPAMRRLSFGQVSSPS